MNKYKSSSQKVRLSIDCGPRERQQIKVLAALHQETITEYVMKSVKERIAREHIHHPNKETAKALQESRKGEGVKTYDNMDELFEDLDF